MVRTLQLTTSNSMPDSVFKFSKVWQLFNAALGGVLLCSSFSGDASAASSEVDYRTDAARIQRALIPGAGLVDSTLLPREVVSGPAEGRLMPSIQERSKQITSNSKSGITSDDELSHARELNVKTPALQALISVQRNLSPLTLDASYVQPVELHDVLNIALEHNLDLNFTRNEASRKHFLYRSAKGNFLPDINAGYSQLLVYGQLGLPYTQNQLFGSNRVGGQSRILNLSFPFSIANAGGRYWLYRGGSVVFGAKQAKHEMNASRSGNFATYSDVLRDASNRYYDLLLAEALLQIRIRAVDTSEEQVRFTGERFKHGLSTNLEYLQARTQLSLDREALLEQEVNRRQAALELTSLINFDQSTDLRTTVPFVVPAKLVNEAVPVNELVRMSISNRPELKQYSELQKAAKAAVVVAAAPLQPTVQASANVLPTGRTGSNVEALFLGAVSVNWQLGGLGTVDYSRMKAARLEARNAEIELKKEMIAVIKDVRSSFLKSSLAEQTIVETAAQVDSAVEELRSAKKRHESGIGTQLDVLTAQRDLTQAQINQATSTIKYNIAQVDLVHAIGLCSVKSLTTGLPASMRN